MATALHIKTTVLPGKRIEITDPELAEGEPVEVFVVTPRGRCRPHRSMLDILRETPPPGLFKTSQDVDRYLEEERNSWDE